MSAVVHQAGELDAALKLPTVMREKIAETVARPEDIDDEVRDVLEVISRQ